MSTIKGGNGRNGIGVNSGSNETSGKGPAQAARVASGASQIVARPEDAPSGGRGFYGQSAANQQIALNAADDDIILNLGGANTVFGSGSAQQSVIDGNGAGTFVTGAGSTTVDGEPGRDLISIVAGGQGMVTARSFNGDGKISLQGYAAGEVNRALSAAAASRPTWCCRMQRRSTFSAPRNWMPGVSYSRQTSPEPSPLRGRERP